MEILLKMILGWYWADYFLEVQNNRSLLAQKEFPLDFIKQEPVFPPVVKICFIPFLIVIVLLLASVCVQNIYRRKKEEQTSFNFLAIQNLTQFTQ